MFNIVVCLCDYEYVVFFSFLVDVFEGNEYTAKSDDTNVEYDTI